MEIAAMKTKLEHGGKIEKEKQLFFLSDILLIWANYIKLDILMIFEWFKTKVHFGFCHQLLRALRIRGKRHKRHNLGTGFFVFKFSKLMKI